MADPDTGAPNPRTLELLRKASTAAISGVLFKMGFRNHWMEGVAPTGPLLKMVGPAFTLRYVPAREDIDVSEIFRDPEHPQRRAIELTPAGHVLVMDCRRDGRAASGGSVLIHRLAARGVAGLVSDGGLRDAQASTSFGLPCFTAGPCAPGNLTHHHAADMQVPIGCGGVAVYPGDIVVGDGDGVIVIPRARADEVAALAAPMEDFEDFVHEQLDLGLALPGLYPANPETRARYEAWLVSTGRRPAPSQA